MNEFKYKEYLLKTMMVALSISALIAISIFLFGEFGETETKILLTTLTLGGFSMTGFGSSLSYEQEKEKLKIIAKCGILISILGFFVSILTIWEVINIESIWKPMLITMVISFTIAQMSVLFRVQAKDDSVKHLKKGTTICICLVGLMLAKSILSEFSEGEFYFRLLGVFVILDVIGSVTTLVKNKMSTQDIENELKDSNIFS